jgi:indole-3-glycerol phosphate synthase
MSILDTLAEQARQRVAADVASLGRAAMARRAYDTPVAADFAFERALAAPGLSLICEVKRASPSRGLIAADFDYLGIARDYAQGGAAAISVLTEPTHFLGADQYLTQIATAVDVPLLRKDFTVDAYQIYQARALGASAVLLICALLTPAQLTDWLGLADDLGLSALTEAHDAAEVAMAVRAGARVIGVNNRNLHDFTVSSATSAGLRHLVPPGRLFVAESGVTVPQDAATAARGGADALLVGEAAMRAADRAGFVRAMRQAADQAMSERSGDRAPGQTMADQAGSHGRAP